jgi:sensor histidine kinase YesM
MPPGREVMSMFIVGGYGFIPGCRRESLLYRVLGTLAINTGLGLAILAIFAIFDFREIAEDFWGQLLLYQIFTHCTADLASFFLPPMAVRLSRFSGWRIWLPFLTLLAAVGFAGSAVATSLALGLGFYPGFTFWPIYGSVAKISIIITLLAGTGTYLVEVQKGRVQATTLQLRTQQLERERALKLAAEARFDSLQSRLQPHFLFNTINSILALLPEDARRAEEMLERLARLLRFALDSQQAPVVRLRDELRLVTDYLEIERTRFGSRLRFQIDASPELMSAEVPAYALQTLIENSMKHAIAPRREGGFIGVSISRDGDSLVAEVRDDGPGFSREALRGGHGLDMLEQRFETLYGTAGSIEIASSEAGACVRFRLPVLVKV